MLTPVFLCKANALCYSEALLCSFFNAIMIVQQQTLAHFMSLETNEGSFLKEGYKELKDKYSQIIGHIVGERL